MMSHRMYRRIRRPNGNRAGKGADLMLKHKTRLHSSERNVVVILSTALLCTDLAFWRREPMPE